MLETTTTYVTLKTNPPPLASRSTSTSTSINDYKFSKIMSFLRFQVTNNLCCNKKNSDLITVKTKWCSWLRQWATSRKAMRSIPDGVTGTFHWHNHSGRTVALGLTQKWVSGIVPGSKGGWCVGLTTLPPSCADYLWNLEASNSWNPQGLPRPVMGLLYLLNK